MGVLGKLGFMNSQDHQQQDRKRGDLLGAFAAYDLWSFLAWQDIKIKYRRSKIGPFWITLSMAIFCVALGMVYSRLFKTQVAELLPFLSIGLVVWGLISSCIGEMPNLFVDNAPYMKDMRINPLIILLRALTRNLIVFGHNLLIVVGIYLFFGIWPGWPMLLAIPGLLLVMLNLLAVSIPLSIVGARFRDLSQITQSMLQVVFFVTPIFWFPRLLAEGSWVIAANPMGYFIDLVRSPLLGQLPNLLSFGVSLLTLLVSSIIAAWIYKSKSPRIAFWV
jgi:ABC-type polysaccharide/polyol phosphate export permease